MVFLLLLLGVTTAQASITKEEAPEYFPDGGAWYPRAEDFTLSRRQELVDLEVVPVENQAVAWNWGDVFKISKDPTAFFGVRFDGYSARENQLFTLASNTKLFTTAAALHFLGADYRFETQLKWSQGSDATQADNLVLVGSGDPTWGLRTVEKGIRTRVAAIVEEFGRAGIREVRGEFQVMSVDPRWDQLEFPPGWLESDKDECYGALPQGFNLQENCSTFRVTSPTTGSWLDEGVPTPVKLKITSGPKTALSLQLVRDQRTRAFSYVVSGTWKSGAKAADFWLPVHDVQGWVKNLFLAALKKEGIAYNPSSSVAQAVSHPVMTFQSIPLSNILRPMNKLSSNLVAGALFQAIGSQAQIQDYFQRLDPTLNTMTVYDGPGISRLNQVTPSGMARFLEILRADSNFPAVWNSLSIAGVDGTLANRMEKTSAEGTVRGKTGTLSGVYNLSGFVPKYDAQRTITDYIPFVIFGRSSPNYRLTVHAIQDRAAAHLFDVVNGP
ncbi:D-alanyl-D-alanine carboxypeptidase/D-alanyl-D-alanine-endopeptidase [bacterium]|jgi:D-alanyl-D-alanine carboxypeptidase/D-alanyl-D-alanine-endopeptidase (penicillin-binding protein 4)|nr:D-alanyl-D-alanine carboxypeptidase/D-alanyl-D-alanine-endopeptidase [bacterium]